MSAKVVAVWDRPIRSFHWLLVVLIGFSWWTAETSRMDWHQYSGLAICFLLVFRILWGFVGSNTARFSHFVRGPAAILRHLGGHDSGRVGHNPLGALSVVALLLTLVIQVATGLFAVDVDGLESGPLSHYVSFQQGRQAAAIHDASFTVLQGLIVLHLAAIAFYLLVKRDNLVRPMVTGSRTVSGSSVAGMEPAPAWRFLLCVSVAALFVWYVAKGFPL